MHLVIRFHKKLIFNLIFILDPIKNCNLSSNLIVFSDSGVLRWEGVPVEAEVANPKLGAKIHLKTNR